ncbi:MAG TPA: acyl-CoA dehydrogenase family protein [Mycobacteriales bacterium]|nr:acyl-CoA dehydrogenase family protein [Mycobacteriales bacterium]
MSQIDGQVEPGVALTDPCETARVVGERAAPYVAIHDREGSFVVEGYTAVRESGYGVLAIPADLGGDDADLGEVCRAQQVLAGYCASTALAIAMHHHTVLSLAVRWRAGDDAVGTFLQRVASENLILCSSGTVDPSKPGLRATRVAGGFRVSGRRPYASGVPGADFLLALAGDTNGEWIINVVIDPAADGVVIHDDWNGMGMRGSGSNSVTLSDVFVADADTYMQRPWPRRGRRPRAGADGAQTPAPPQGTVSPALRRLPLRIHGLMVALPVITAVYVGAGTAMYERAVALLSEGRRAHEEVTYRLVGEMASHQHTAATALESMVSEVHDDALGSEDLYVRVMLAKRQAVLASISTVELGMEALGAMSYDRDQPFEQALRDLRAGITHPLPPEHTLRGVGRSIMVRADWARGATD